MKKSIFFSVLLAVTLASCTSDMRLFSYKEIEPVKNELYTEECSACHFAFPPGFLPERSWKLLMAGLEDHFGDDASLDEEDVQQILTFLQNNSADQSVYKRSRKVMASLDNAKTPTPLRITKVPYIADKHHLIPKKYILDNEKVKSLSNCNACHQKSDKGIFDDDTVLIPNYGRYEG